MNQITVRIRHEDNVEAVHLCTWEVDRLDELIPMVRRWGLSYGGESSYSDWEIVGEFRLDETAAYFLLLLSDPEPVS